MRQYRRELLGREHGGVVCVCEPNVHAVLSCVSRPPRRFVGAWRSCRSNDSESKRLNYGPLDTPVERVGASIEARCPWAVHHQSPRLVILQEPGLQRVAAQQLSGNLLTAPARVACGLVATVQIVVPHGLTRTRGDSPLAHGWSRRRLSCARRASSTNKNTGPCHTAATAHGVLPI